MPRQYAILSFTLILLIPATLARGADQSPASSAYVSIPPGTTITMLNWQNFRQYMADGMVAMFEGKSAWNMPDDVAMEIGPPLEYPLPKNYPRSNREVLEPDQNR
jgi:hypothetical protein